MIKIDTLPKRISFNINKKWNVVSTDSYIIASKKLSDGSTTQLCLTKDGQKRELLFNNEKIMDTVDNKGVKRVYRYLRTDANTIKGQMITTQDKHGEYPLILAAKWVLKNFVPEKLILKINKNHPQANIFIPKKSEDGTPIFDGEINKLNVTEILAKDFENWTFPLPKTIILKTSKGFEHRIINESAEDNQQILEHFGINSKELLGQNIRTIV